MHEWQDLLFKAYGIFEMKNYWKRYKSIEFLNIWLSKKFVRAGSHTICQLLKKKKALVAWSKEMLQKYDRSARNTSMTSWQVMNSGFTRMFQDEPNPIKVARTRSTSKQMIACFFGKTRHVRLEQRRTVNSEWYTTICLPVVFQKNEDVSLFTTTMRVLTHRFKQLHFWATKTSIWWFIRHIHSRLGTEWLLFIPVRKKIRSQRFSTFEEAVDILIRVAKVLRQLVQTQANVYRS